MFLLIFELLCGYMVVWLYGFIVVWLLDDLVLFF